MIKLKFFLSKHDFFAERKLYITHYDLYMHKLSLKLKFSYKFRCRIRSLFFFFSHKAKKNRCITHNSLCSTYTQTFLRITIFELNELLLCKTQYKRGIFCHMIIRIYISFFILHFFLFFIKQKEIIVYI